MGWSSAAESRSRTSSAESASICSATTRRAGSSQKRAEKAARPSSHGAKTPTKICSMDRGFGGSRSRVSSVGTATPPSKKRERQRLYCTMVSVAMALKPGAR